MQPFDIPIIHNTYELYKSLHELQRTIPKADRYTVWQRSENTTLEILAGLVHVGYLPQETRQQKLTDTSAHLDMLRIFIRLSFEVKAISQKKYILLQEKIDEIGRMLGGWIKSFKQK